LFLFVSDQKFGEDRWRALLSPLLFAGHVDGPGLFAYLITILSVLLIILTLPVSLIFAVKVVQVQFSTMYSELKGQCHEMGFFEGLKILISTFCVCVDGYQGLSKSFQFSLPYTNIKFLFAVKMLTKTLLRVPFSDIGCSLQGKCARINLSQAASRMILHNHRRLPEGDISFQ
jgi:hypothetical protein